MSSHPLSSDETKLRLDRQILAVLESISDGFIVLDTHWCYSYVNRAAETILQKQREDLLGKNVWEVFPEAVSTTFWTKYYEAADTQTIVEFEAFYPPFGKWFHVRVYPTESGLAVYFQDITERKQIEEDQLRLAAIVASSDDAIIGKTLDGIITSWNLAAEKMFGYTAQEAIGKHISLIIPVELREEEDVIIQKLRNGQHIDHFETVRVRKDGTRIHLSLSISPIKNKEGQIIGASKIARDISERKQLQQHLHFLSHASKVLSSSLDYKMTLQTIANLAVPQIADWCTIDMLAEDGSIEQLVIAHADPKRVQWAKEIRKKYPLDMNATNGIPQVFRTGTPVFAPFISDEMLAATVVNSEQLTLLRKVGFTSGMTIPLLVNGKAIGTVTFALAESGRHYTQADVAMAEELASHASLAIQNAQLYREVQQSRDQLDIILQGVADGIVVYDTDSRIIYANEAAAQMTGSTSVQTMLKAASTGIADKYEIVDEQGQPFPRSRFTHIRVLAGEREAQATIGYSNTQTGKPERWSLVKSRPVLDERGEVTMVVTIIHDITERVLAEQRKDEFISMTSHELKTPVTSLKGFTNVLQRRLAKQGDEKSLYYLARIDAQLNKLAKLISDLLDITRMQTGKLTFQMEAFDLDVLMCETVENVQATTITHRFLIEGRTDARLCGDKDRLGQVFSNLLTNAVKYSPRANKVLVGLSRDQEQAIVSVRDFGIGIDEAHHQKIFERFYQVTDPEERTYPGLGIGLYISREIVERHHGQIGVESRKGEGAIFSVALPLLAEGK